MEPRKPTRDDRRRNLTKAAQRYIDTQMPNGADTSDVCELSYQWAVFAGYGTDAAVTISNIVAAIHTEVK